MTFKNKLWVIAAFAIQSSVAVALPVSGSQDAAVQAGSDFLQLLYGVGPDQVKVGKTSFNDNAAILQIRTAANECNLELIKKASANKYGWELQIHSCTKAK